MVQLIKRVISVGAAAVIGALGMACSGERKLEACRFIEIEPAERNSIRETITERAIREGWELEALCGDSLIDFKGSWLLNQLGVDIKSAYDEADPNKGAATLAQNGLSIKIDEASGRRNPKIWATSSTVDDEIQAKKGNAWNFDN